MFGYFGLAYVEAALVGALGGLVGLLVVLRRRTFFATALTHATFPGAIVAVLVGWNVLVGNALFAVVLTLLMLLLARIPNQGAQVASGVVLTGGFALGTVLEGLNPSLPVKAQSFLVGSILSVDASDVAVAAGLLAVVAVVMWALRRRLLFSSFDVQGYRAAGYQPWAVDAVVLVIITVTVVVLMPAVGAILAIAILAAPPLAAQMISADVTRMVWLSPTIGAISGVAGLRVSATWPVSAGAAIVLVASALLLLAVLGRWVVRTERRYWARKHS
ncbi:metal ABC transporter permease [Pseudoclavibacter soli]|uniref:metal ABC transporter permease n=1 Tax=Pseudoclavibacter soli TaxID=452623 RepID=UPI000408E92F|nr:metal ABC transporter permease [Pseudoclavibacter soli]